MAKTLSAASLLKNPSNKGVDFTTPLQVISGAYLTADCLATSHASTKDLKTGAIQENTILHVPSTTVDRDIIASLQKGEGMRVAKSG